MSAFNCDFQMVKRLILKDWQIYQKQLAAYVAGLLLALTLIGTGKAIPFYLGALMLLVLLICAGGFAIQSSLINERKEHTMPFIMSLPVTPMDFYWAKILANATLFLVPFLLVLGGTVALVLLTPLPDGLLVWSLLIYLFLAMNFVISLCVAIVVESEGWNIFTIITLSTLTSPFMMGIGMFDAIGKNIKTEHIVWSLPALAILSAQLLIIAITLGVTSWVQSRKTSFL
jgi:ABC-2 type transport system permease protein